MIYDKKKIILGLFSLLFGTAINLAQTTNTGVLKVEPNTIFSSVSDFDNKASATYTNDGEAYFYSHFNNDGTVDFTTTENGQCYTRFEGSAVQQLTGGETSYFYDVLFNNSVNNPTNAYELHSQISVAHEADFTKGIVKDDDFGGLLIFEDVATHKSVSNDSHVDGLVQKKGDEVFNYPIGDNQFYRFAAISAPSDIDHRFSAKYFFQNPIGSTVGTETPTANMAPTLEVLDNAEFWTIVRNIGSGHVALTLSYDAQTTPASVMTPENSLKIVRWNASSELWEDLGGVVDVTSKTVTTLADLTNYGIFTLAKSKTATPPPSDEFEIFNGISNNGDGKNDYFKINGLSGPNNVKIFNRWGVKVFESDNYDTSGNVFRGYSNGRATIQSGEKLPTGTYFYVLTYQVNGQNRNKSGYLYITTD